MQKKLIALAIAGIVAAPAFAADNVTIYGVAGAYLQSLKTDVTTTATGATVNTSVSQVQTDGESGSRIGFKGTEDLGGGLKANFVIESALAMDAAGTTAASGVTGLGNRQAYVGLSGNWGAVNLGRQYSSEFYHMAVREVWGYADWSASAAPAGMRLRRHPHQQFHRLHFAQLQRLLRPSALWLQRRHSCSEERWSNHRSES